MSNENDMLLTRLGNCLISIFKTRNIVQCKNPGDGALHNFMGRYVPLTSQTPRIFHIF